MKKKIIVAAFGIFGILLCCCQMPPNGEISYAHVGPVLDETNMFEWIGSMDYVFTGTVEKVNKKTIRGGYAPEEYYAVKVEENLKGTLFTDSNIEVKKNGGYLKDGTLVLYRSDNVIGTGLCEVGEKYIFMGQGQPNGDLLLDALYGNVEYTDELKTDYINYIKNQIETELIYPWWERFPCRYDPAY
ncbi:MAG: hypothetical protein LBQ94_03715 [Treponema sp.]|jgi:hypothetical protein|nr:hypothetical protein [Treponema sp.]